MSGVPSGLFALTTNIRLGWKCLAGTNALAYNRAFWYLREKRKGVPCELLALNAHIRLRWKCLAGTNALAYNSAFWY
jgi:hypothetical protein